MRVVLAVLALATVARADDDVDVSGRESTELRGDAMVWEDGALYLEPSEGATFVRFSTFGRPRRDEVGRAFPVKIVAAALRDFVEVELVDATTCVERHATVDQRITGVHFFVKRKDLAPVLAKPFAIKHADGTGVRLQPGVPLTPTASGAYLVSARGDLVRLSVPHASVGFTYRRKKVHEPALPKGQLWRLDRTQNVKLGDDELEARANWLATKPAKHGDIVNLRWVTRCIELVVAVPAKSLRKVPRPPTESFGFGRSGYKPTHTIPRGTPLSTPSGREVAIAAETIEVQPPVGDKACFEASVTLWAGDSGALARTMQLCAPANVVEGPPVAAAPVSDPLAAPADVAAPPPDAHRTARGTYWKTLRSAGGGRRPLESSTVTVHYTGWTTDGTMFDSSYTRGTPARFALNAVIAGWSDGLQQIATGDKVRLWIPEELAYKGRTGAPKGMLVFDVELFNVE